MKASLKSNGRPSDYRPPTIEFSDACRLPEDTAGVATLIYRVEITAGQAIKELAGAEAELDALEAAGLDSSTSPRRLQLEALRALDPKTPVGYRLQNSVLSGIPPRGRLVAIVTKRGRLADGRLDAEVTVVPQVAELVEGYDLLDGLRSAYLFLEQAESAAWFLQGAEVPKFQAAEVVPLEGFPRKA